MRRRELIDVAMGRTPADLVIEGGTLVNVSTASCTRRALRSRRSNRRNR